MKIHPNDEIFKNGYPEKVKKNEKTEHKDFGAIFRQIIQKSSKLNTGAQKPAIINNVSPIKFNTFSPAEKIPIMDRLERFLDILDEYHQKLGNPQVTLRNIYPTINRMEVEKESLIPVLNSLPDRDELKDILNHALITASLEAIKFNRGDYLTPYSQ